MKYLTNRQITKLYTVSFATVQKWINAANDHRNDLQIGEAEPGKWQVADTNKNHEIMKGLVARGKTRKNRLALKAVEPRREFYTLYDRSQQLGIISSIETRREIPFQYNYFGVGVEDWDKYEQRLLNEKTSNSLKHTIDLLDSNLPDLDRFIGDRQVNVVDLGVGNALPVRGLIEHLLKRHMLGRYIGIDISPDMLAVAKENVDSWFDGKVTVETHVRDISTEGFEDLLADDYLKPEESRPINLVLLLGGTILNFRRPHDVLRLVNASMSPSDMFICTNKLDTSNSRRYFDFNASEDSAALLSAIDSVVVDLLGIAPSMYDVEQFYDDAIRSRLIRIRMKLDLSLRFGFSSGERRLEVSKNDAITLWRAWQLTARELFDRLDAAEFELLKSSLTVDDEYLITMSRPHVG